MQRFLTFLEPEKDPFGAGYQLIVAIAFGQGQFSVFRIASKNCTCLRLIPTLSWPLLPASGFVGVMGVIAVVLMLVCAFNYWSRCLMVDQRYGGYLAYGIGVWFSIQAL